MALYVKNAGRGALFIIGRKDIRNSAPAISPVRASIIANRVYRKRSFNPLVKDMYLAKKAFSRAVGVNAVNVVITYMVKFNEAAERCLDSDGKCTVNNVCNVFLARENSPRAKNSPNRSREKEEGTRRHIRISRVRRAR